MPDPQKPESILPEGTRRRRNATLVLAVCVLLLFLGLAALNAFNLKNLEPSTTAGIFFFTALSAVGLLVFVGILVTLVRNVLKLYAEQRSRVLGTRLRTRMLWGAVLLSLVPIAFMFCFSYLLMNRAVERWFSQPAATLRDNATQIGTDLSRYASANARAEATGLANALASADGSLLKDGAALNSALRNHEMNLQGGFALVFREDSPIAKFHLPSGTEASLRNWDTLSSIDAAQLAKPETVQGPTQNVILEAAHRSDEPIVVIGTTDYTIGSAWLKDRTFVVVGLPLPHGMSETLQQMQQSANQYWTLFRLRRQIRGTYMLLLMMITSLALFAACWLALHLSKQVTRPIETLADAMDEIARGHYEHRVADAATEELGELVHSFNAMAADLEQSRAQLEASNLQVFEANAVSDRRRRELEAMLQTIPNGVVLLDAQRRISVVNRAFCEMIDPGGPMQFEGTIEENLPADAREPIYKLLQRSHRMGSAETELEMQTNSGTLNIAASAALIESSLGSERLTSGYVLVLENATELLRAQKQSAWKEVARRVAHEIKNPLTPISLGAEQIRRHIKRIAETLREAQIESPSVEVIHHSSEVISSSVESMRSLVDQFSSLAQFPNAQPRPADLNTIVENSLALFAGRLQSVQVVKKLASGLPLVMADPEALKRALSNLIDNAAEAMQNSLVREVHVSTKLSDQAGMAEIVVADSGPGVTNEMRERLFLPYFSTKQRGTGLGLTIAAKIMQDHQGSIRVEQNLPTGARFLLDVPIAAVARNSGAHPTVTSEEIDV